MKVIRTMDDLIEIFPTMTQSQIISLYRQTLVIIKRYNDRLGLARDKEEESLCLEKLSEFLEYSDFLSGYLARCYCVLNGYDVTL